MVERVARAVMEANGENECLPMQDYLAMARAAITAMREPTRAMLEDGERTTFEWVAEVSDWQLQNIKEGWQAMIDKALEEP